MPFAVTNQTIGAAGTLEDSFVAPSASRPNDFTPLNPSVVNVVNVGIAPPAPTTGTLATTIEYAQGIVSESVAEYGVQETPVVITLLATLEDAALLAEYLIRSAPAFWFGNIQIIMNGLTDAQRTTINSLDIGSQVSVTKSFPNSTPSTVTQLMALEGISHDISPDRHIVTLYPNPARIYTYFIVGGYTTTTTRTNLVVNPNFETGITGWTNTNVNYTVAASTADAYIGTGSLLLTCNATSGLNGGAEFLNNATYRIPCAQGQTFTASAYFKNLVGTRNWRVVFFTYQTSTSTTTVESFLTGTAITNPTTWTQASSTCTLTNANSNFLEIRLGNANTGAIGDQVYCDAVLVEQTSSLLPYFDGTYAEPYTGYTLTEQAWNGTANASTSTATWGLTSSFVGSELDDVTKGLG
jgi:hypothetical protein